RTVQHVQTAVVGRNAKRCIGNESWIVRTHRGNQRTGTAGSQTSSLARCAVVANHRGNRAERFDTVNGIRISVIKFENGRREERTGVVVAGNFLWAAQANLATGVDELLGGIGDVALLILGS